RVGRGSRRHAMKVCARVGPRRSRLERHDPLGLGPLRPSPVMETHMPNELLASLRRLSDGELVARAKTLTAGERGPPARPVSHLAELAPRELHLRAGSPSIFVYCRLALAPSEHEPYTRTEAARAARRFPVILERLAEGALNLTTVRLLA